MSEHTCRQHRQLVAEARDLDLQPAPRDGKVGVQLGDTGLEGQGRVRVETGDIEWEEGGRGGWSMRNRAGEHALLEPAMFASRMHPDPRSETLTLSA